MPTYSYECKKCGHTQDVFHGMSETPRIKCGECGGATKKLLGTGAGIIFKGSGFYETDYKKAANGNGSKPESKSETKTETKTESSKSSTETAKPAEKKTAAKKD